MATYFRVVESGTHTGRPHVHAVVAGSLPYVRAPRDRESLASWGADLTGEGRQMVAALELAGFGPMCHAEHLHGGAQGAATYLGGYLSKSEKRLLRPDGRTVRVAEGARDWPAAEHDKTTYMAGAVSVEPSGCPAECVQCGQERAAAESQDWSALRRLNVAWWWRHVDPCDAGVQAEVRAALEAADRYKAARAAVPPGRRHLIVGRRTETPADSTTTVGRAGAVPAGAGGRPDTVPVPPDVAGAVWCRRVATEALERVRRRGYDGSVRLLRDMAAAGYDVEAVVA